LLKQLIFIALLGFWKGEVIAFFEITVYRYRIILFSADEISYL